MRKLILLAAIALIGAAATTGQEGTGGGFTRTFSAPQAGWFTAPVDTHFWLYSGRNITVTDDRGKPLPHRIIPDAFPASPHPSQPILYDIEREKTRVILLLKVRSANRWHHQLQIAFSEPAFYPEVLLEGSRDGRHWKAMAQGKLFALSGESRMQRVALDYPPSDVTRLRLTVPLERGRRLPEIRTISLDYLPAGKASPWIDERVGLTRVEDDLARAFCRSGERAYVITLPGKIHAVSSMDLPLTGSHPYARVSLWHMDGGVPVFSYTCYLGPSGKRIPVPGGTLHSPLVLVLPPDIPAVDHVTLHRRGSHLTFYANRPGEITVTYGMVERRPFHDLRARHHGIPTPCTLSPPQPVSLCLSPQLFPYAKVDAGKVPKAEAVWTLGSLPEEREWPWVQLSVSDEIYAPTGGNPGALRLYAGERLLPHLRVVMPWPVKVLSRRLNLKPVERRPEELQGILTWKGKNLPLLFMTLTSPARPIDADLQIQVPVESGRVPPGEEKPPRWRTIERRKLLSGPWDDRDTWVIHLGTVASSSFRLLLRGNELPPPDYLKVSLWRRDDRILFALPPVETPVLLYAKGFPALSTTFHRYINPEAFPTDLPMLTIRSGGRAAGGDGKIRRLLFILSLCLASIVLIFLTFRLLKREA